MTVTRKPKAKPAASESQIAALIGKGGSAARQEERPPQAAKSTPVALRIPTPLAERLASALQDKPVRVPRHTWILEAIVEKLERESG